MKKEMIKFIEENFEVIKSQFLKDELKILSDCGEDEDELDSVYFEINFISKAEVLLEVINERTLGVDYDDEGDVNQLFDMIKAIKEVAN